jgi:hypothetical protein
MTRPRLIKAGNYAASGSILDLLVVEKCDWGNIAVPKSESLDSARCCGACGFRIVQCTPSRSAAVPSLMADARGSRRIGARRLPAALAANPNGPVKSLGAPRPNRSRTTLATDLSNLARRT